VCDVRSIAVPVNPPAAMVEAEQPAANTFPIPLVAAA
jgi:bacterioferritin-associated ferredoxin